MQLVNSVIFDLDGTLIDSAPGILTGFADVLIEAGISPVIPLDSSIIGPPMLKTLQAISGIADDNTLELMASRFKEMYDTAGYRQTTVYAGVQQMLDSLLQNEVPMFIATNKRKAPTIRILKHFGWERFFRQVGTLDTPSPPHKDKAALIASIMAGQGLCASTTLYVGDKHDDAVAAKENNMPFAAAAWGYGEWDHAYSMGAGFHLVQSPADVVKLIPLKFSGATD